MLGDRRLGTLEAMSHHALSTILPTLAAGWLMVVAGLGKRRLELRPKACPTCGRRICRCAARA
jgi:hypothetical protein